MFSRRRSRWMIALLISAGLGALAALLADDVVAGVVASVVMFGGFALMSWELAPWVRRDGGKDW